MHGYDDRVYSNAGNPAVVDLVDRDARTVLDVGCGAGDNAALLRARDPDKHIFGITASQAEVAQALRHMNDCWLADIELGVPEPARARTYDTLIFSHVLEHLRDPSAVVREFSRYLRVGGSCIIAVPNVVALRERLDFMMGRFEYRSSGTLDETHLRFFSHDTAARYLLSQAPDLSVSRTFATGSVPLWFLRRRLSRRTLARIDDLGCRLRPNLFGAQVIIQAVKQR